MPFRRSSQFFISAVVVVALAAAGCASSASRVDPGTRPAKTPTTRATDSGVSTGTGTGRAASTAGPYAVGKLSVTYVDQSRKTNADPMRGFAEKPERTLPVMLMYPATGPASDDGTATDAAAPAPGRFPLVLFSHGITASGPIYSTLLQRWARAGYVVAAPTYPLTSVGAKFPGDPVALADYQNQPADLRFVLDSVLKQSGDTKDPLHGHIDADHIAAAGHSLGAITTIGYVFNTCCIDKRIKAAVEVSGIELPFPNGSFEPFAKTPLLLIHGQRDSTVPVAGSDTIWKGVTGPAYYLRYDGAGHIDAIFPGRFYETTVKVSIDFFNAELKGDRSGLEQDPAAVAASGLGTLTAKNT